MGQNERDPKRKRATYNLTYPVDTKNVTRETLAEMRAASTEAAKSKTKPPLTAKKITWSIKYTEVPPHVYDQCNFHVTSGASATEIISLTFTDSTFTRCIFGTIHFCSTRFKDCTFRQCDFSHAHFESCTFEDCRFEACTAWGADFTATTIDPKSFLGGVSLPIDHFADAEADKPAIKAEWIAEDARLAGAVLRSNEECRHASFTEVATHMSKDRNLRAEWQAFRDRKRPKHAIFGLLTSYLIAQATKGGTSLSRLLWIAAALILALAYLLPERTLIPEGSASDAGSRISRAAGAFFGFGFTNLRLAAQADIVLATGAAVCGLLWYALFAAVLIRRFYR